MAALRAFEVPTDEVHFDTTSVSVYGDYLGSTHEGSALKITNGHSKDHRPDLKQFVFSLLCTGGNIPIIGRCEDGNASDKTLNNTLLSTISQRLKRTGIQEQAFTYIVDSALVTAIAIGLLAGIALLVSGFAQGAACAAAINASKSKPEVFGISIAPAAVVEGFAVFAFVFALVLAGSVPGMGG